MDDWDHVVDVNIKGVLHTIGHLLPHFLSQQTGHIVNISSIAGHKVMPTAAVYCATKFAVHAISEGLRSELSKHAQSEPHTIRVTEIAPGLVETELRHSITHEKTRQQVSNWLAGMKIHFNLKMLQEAFARRWRHHNMLGSTKFFFAQLKKFTERR